jgi:hypothetical protein
MREGFASVLGRFEAIVTLDGDGQHDPTEIPALLAAFSRADLVLGRRRRERTAMPRARRFSNAFSAALVSLLARRRLSDVHCGYRVYRGSALRRVEIRSNGFDIEVELLLKAARLGWRIVDSPVRTLYGEERSKISPVVDALHFLRATALYGLGLDL